LLTNEPSNVATTVSTIEPINAGKKTVTTKPGVMTPTNHSIKALMTSKNKPKVKRVIGEVKSTKIGRIMALTNPKITAAIAAAV
jgi:hypothetical protein